MKKGIFWMIAVGLVFFFGLMLNRAPAAEPVKIAAHGEFTGKSSPYGMGVLQAVRFEVKKKNEAGGIKSLGGAKIELIEEDNASQPKDAVASHERLASNKEILAIVGPTLTPQATPVEPIAGKYRITSIFPITTTDSVFENKNKYVFSTTIMGSRIGEGYARFMLDMHKKYKVPLNRITYSYPDTEYGINVGRSFKAVLKGAGFEKNIVLDLPFDSNLKDLTPVVLKLKAANPDFHCQVGYFADGKLFHDACFNLKFNPLQVGGANGFNHPDLWKVLGARIAEETIGSKKTFFLDTACFDLPNPARDSWIKSFSTENPKVPVEQNLLLGAESIRLLLEAMEAAGKRDREAIAEAMHKMNFQKDDSRDIMGNFEKPGLAFGPDGKPNTWGFISQWDKKGDNLGKLSVYHPGMGWISGPKMFK